MPENAAASLNQKFELRAYTVYFDIIDSLAAEELLDSLDRATPVFKQVFKEHFGVFLFVFRGFGKDIADLLKAFFFGSFGCIDITHPGLRLSGKGLD